MKPEAFKNLVELFDARAQKHAKKTAIVFGAKKISYRELALYTQKTAQALQKLGVVRGERVAVWLPNCPEFVYAYFGTLRLGATVVPINSMFKREEAKFVLADSAARVLICSIDKIGEAEVIRGRVETLRYLICVPFCKACNKELVRGFNELILLEAPFTGAVSIESDSIAEILYTSGTTGTPKGTCLTHKNLLVNTADAQNAIDVSNKDVFLCILPLFHSFASTVCMLLPLREGATIVIMRAIRPFKRIVRAIFKNRVTVFVAVPSLYKILADMKLQGFKLFLARIANPIRICISGAAALPTETLAKFQKKLKRILLEGYGLTEAAPIVSLNPLTGRRKAGSVGLPLASVTVKVVDSHDRTLGANEIGELLVKGDSVMQGYFKLPKETERTLRDGWLHTGDLAKIDEDGYIYIVDRAKDMINVRGLNVYPKEIEELLYKHPGVKEASVIGVAHRHRGEVPIAFIVKEGEMGERECIRYMRASLAAYKVPLRIIFKESLPKNATGKILKRVLREEVKDTFT